MICHSNILSYQKTDEINAPKVVDLVIDNIL